MRHESDLGIADANHDGNAARDRLANLMLAAERKRGDAARAIVPRASDECVAPLSYAQERLWFLDQLGLVQTAYNIPLALRLEGHLNVEALERSLGELICRHESLRTRFESVAGSQVQIIDPPGAFSLEICDLSDMAEEERSLEVQRLSNEAAQWSFDLAKGQPLRTLLLKLHAQEHVLLLTMHHIASDGWSLGILNRELGALYRAYASGQPSSLPHLRIQYADYAIWQRQWLQGTVLNDHLQYWKEHLRGASLQLQLPTDRPRPAVESFKGAVVDFELPPNLHRALNELARREGVTPFMLFLAAYQLLLSRWSGQEDLIVGSPVAGRTHTQTEGLIGFFVNMLVLRTDLSGNPSFRQLLGRIKEVALGAYAHQDLPFEKLVMELRPERNLNHHPIFQVTLALQNFPKEDLELSGLKWTPIAAEHKTTRYDLTLHLFEVNEEMGGQFEYATDLFNRGTMERMAAQFRTLLEAVVADPDCLIQQLPLLTADERHRVLVEWNETAAEYPRNRCIPELFGEQASKTPSAVALIHGDWELTYQELDERSNQLAHHLCDLGVCPETIVGLFIDRSPEMVIGMLGILKAGGAYVPLDPNYPPERLHYMLRDAAPKVVLTREQLRDRLPDAAAMIVALDRDWKKIAERPTSNLDCKALGLRSCHLAYVIYTSGSTGQPKGVMVEHRNVVSFWQGLEHIYRQSNQCQRIGVNASLNFDASVQQFIQLLSGRTLVLVQEECRWHAVMLRSFIDEHRIDGIDCTPLQLKSWLAAGFFKRVEGHQLRLVLVGGEPIDPELWRSLAQCSETDFYNVYGPTEGTVDTTFASLKGDTTSPHIGRPMENRRVYILDRYAQPVPIGVEGEIYIGGTGVARGYLNRPELTAERFLPDPFGLESQPRMYKTGDLARWRANGNIECRGRNDRQVKVRGFRIELEEIEAQLTRHPQVKEAATIACENRPGEKHLVAYFTQRDQSGPSVEELRAHLKAVLPEYMVPSAFITLECMPRTPSGKLDREALLAPEFGVFMGRQFEAPQGEVEEILAEIWKTLLRVERVGRHDNFFELGGHSLLIVQMMEGLHRVGLSMNVRSLFENPTLKDLANSLAGETTDKFEVPPNLIPEACEAIKPQMLSLVELKVEHVERIAQSVPGGAGNIQDIYPLTPFQEGILFHHVLNQQRGDVYVSPAVLLVSSRSRLNELIAALQAVIDRNDVLRTAVLWEQLPQPVQVVYRKATLPVEEVALDPTRSSAAQIQEWLKPERQKLNLRQAPLLRLEVAADVQSEQWYVLWQIHHIIGDVESVKVLIAEIVTHLDGRAQTLQKPVPYRNHVAHALAHARTGDAEAFFRSKLSDVHEPTLPFGLGDVHADGSRVVEAHREFEPSLAQRVRNQARRFGVSAATLFHAGWSLVVAHTSGRADVVFGTVLFGRLQGSDDARRILGVHINTLPLRLRLEGVTAKELVEQTQRELLELLTYDQASLAVAQRCSGIAGSAPLFGALLNYRHSISAAAAPWSAVAGVRELASLERTNYPITLSVDDLGEGFALSAQTDRRVDPHRLTEYVHAAVKSLVVALEEAPQTLAMDLSILPTDERQQILEQFNATHSAYPSDELIHELFEQQVERTPQAVAASCAGQYLTYRQLNCRANQLARYLKNQGVVPDCFVGLCIERGIEMVVGILGILKAGGAYVPLDPNYPAERLEYILKDTAPKAVLAQERLRDKLGGISVPIISLDTQWSEIGRESATNLEPKATGLNSGNLAYVIYTSGSTGLPKGVAIEHRNAVNLICWAQSAMPWEMFDETLQSTSLNFDLSVYECFVPLTTGGRLRIVENALAIGNEPPGTTLINTVPSAIGGILDSTGIPKTVRVVNLAGEPLKKQVVDRIFASSAVEQVCNLYGPSETTTYSSWISMFRADGFNPTIGKPIANTRIYVLDAHRKLVPMGVAGEIYIGGAGVARGYLNRPELTEERFLPDPYRDDPHARMYKTGDLGRWRDDGTIEYLGRNDHQIKIRGFRIELGEIESWLVRHEQVKDAVVISTEEDASGGRRLVAYVTSRGDRVPRAEDLRTYLKDKLPEYMVPSAFVILDALPLTPNGKLDRKALPAPELDAFVSRNYESAQGEVEEVLVGIWQSLLQVERVGRQDNFFELGGHSLLIVRMMERLRRVGFSVEARSVFESATLAELADSITSKVATRQYAVLSNLIPPGCEAIKPEMLTLLKLEAEQIDRITQSVPGGAGNVEDIYPLTPLQEGILFHHLLDSDRGDTYVMPFVFEVSSRSRLEELIASLQGVIDRYDVLRTAILWEQLPRPIQVIYRRAILPVEEIKLDPNLNVADQVNDWVSLQRQRMDLRHAPLVRLQVAHDREHDKSYVVMRLHHIVIDAVSLRAVMSDVAARLEGGTSEDFETVPYRNHVAQSLAYAAENDAEAFFRRKLGEIDEPTAPFGLLEVHGTSGQIEAAQEEVESQLARRVRHHAGRLGVSVATFFHAAWGLVVAHTSNRDDVVFGSVLLGRLLGNAATERTLGLFINTLPLRLRLKDVTAEELVEYTQKELVELLSHEQASLAVAQRCSGIDGSAPLFNALLNFRHGNGDESAHWASMSGIRIVARRNGTNYPITLSVDDHTQGFTLTAQTDRRIDPSRMTRYMQTALQSLVQALEERPKTPALALSILPNSEHEEVLKVFNDTHVAFPREKLVHELFEEQAARTPDLVAVVYEGQSLTYSELNRKANQLAHYLRANGVQPDQAVGICVNRKLAMVISLLGILKAGGAYLPLDPSYPAGRLKYMLENAAPLLILTEDEFTDSLLVAGAKVITVEKKLKDISGYGEDNILAADLGVSAQNLAYVIYTSGSTGHPKGVAMPHASMFNLIEWHRKNLPLKAGERVLQFAALSFDVAFQEIFSTLCTGGTLALLDEWIRRDSQALMAFLQNQQIQRLFLPPLMLQSLAECFQATRTLLGSLRDIITAGEQLRVSSEIVNLFQNLPECRLHNHYGPTESHVVTSLTLEGKTNGWPVFPPIGKPICNTQLYVLDEDRRPTPIGVAGEIYIGGRAVARGYLNRRELTAERFLPDPFSSDSRARLYKTGDLGRWRVDGVLECLGRSDHQVKIRGFRIELEEIEAQLALHEAVREAAVIAREDVPGEKRLVAYVIASDRCAPQVEDLRTHLKSALPDYMVPSAFILLDAFPLTPSGKLDRRSLPAPEHGAYAIHEYEPPRGEIEETLAKIWQELLGVERIGRNENLLDAGAHSLLVLKALLRINLTLGCGLRVLDVYNSPTIEDLAVRIGGGETADRLVSLDREATLDEGIVARPGHPSSPAAAVMLTGGTGFVGRFLLAHLVNCTDATIYCLVRAQTQDEAMSRLRGTLIKWDLWREEYDHRIVAIPGDLRLPRFGIEATCYRTLGREVDSVYHCGTSMNHLETYATAKAANVDSARELVKFAAEAKPKLINYISTLGVFSSTTTESPRTLSETSSIDDEKHYHSHGYVASKWVGEKIFMNANKRGIPCNIFRIGLVWADSQQGRYDELQRVYRIFKSCLLSGYGIKNYRFDMAPVPVDYVARAVVFLANEYLTGRKIFHIASPGKTVEDVFESCSRVAGTSLELLPYYEWVQTIKRLHNEGLSLPVVPLIEYAFSMDEVSFREHQLDIGSSRIRFDCTQTRRELDRAGIIPPLLNEDLLDLCLESMSSRDEELQGLMDYKENSQRTQQDAELRLGG